MKDNECIKALLPINENSIYGKTYIIRETKISSLLFKAENRQILNIRLIENIFKYLYAFLKTC
jgi:hypothetical protein